jgi:hypothetical protein
MLIAAVRSTISPSFRCHMGTGGMAQRHRWERARAPFSTESGLATTNGRPLRAAIWRAHADALDTILQIQ